MQNIKHLIFIAGEASGDLRGSGLASAIKTLHPSIKISGIGGPHMKAAGVELFRDITDLAVIGFWEVIKHYLRLRHVFHDTLKRIKEQQPDGVVLIDYPGFNLRLAKHLKCMGIKVFYYISPQVWAWKEHRIKQIQRDVDHMMVLFPFEKDFYDERNIPVHYVGHPLVDEVNVTQPKKETCTSLGLDNNKEILALLPGSREKEIEKHLPVMLETAIKLNQHQPLQVVLAQAKSVDPKLFEHILKQYDIPVTIANHYYNTIAASDLAIVASGTATLETGLLQTPMAVIYKTSPLTYRLFKTFIKIPHISLVNILMQKEVVKEFVQQDMTATNLTNYLQDLRNNEDKRNKMIADLHHVKDKLGTSGASVKAAKVVIDNI